MIPTRYGYLDAYIIGLIAGWLIGFCMARFIGSKRRAALTQEPTP